MIFHDIEQNSEEWYQMRAGKLTGSSFGKIMANFGKAFGEPAKKLAMSTAVERVTGKPIKSDYTNDHMMRGHEQEPIARSLYEEELFYDVKNGGFFDCGDIGCSPDGLVGDDGVIEIKSVIATTHLSSISKQSYDPAYKWQLIGNLFYTQRQWIDFVSYCADFPDEKQIYICRIERSTLNMEVEKLQERVEQFLKLVEEYKDIILNSDYMVKL
jgi:hypothetical protein